MSKILVGYLKQFPTSFAILPSESDSGMVTSVPLCWGVTSVPGPVSVLIVTFPEKKRKEKKKKKVITLFSTYSHGQKYQNPCNSVRKCSPSLRKFLQLQMFWYSRVFFVFLHWNTKKNKKSQI